MLSLLTALFCLQNALPGAVVDRATEVEVGYLRFVVDPRMGGALTEFGFSGEKRNLAGGGPPTHRSQHAPSLIRNSEPQPASAAHPTRTTQSAPAISVPSNAPGH